MALPFIRAGKKGSLLALFRRGEFTPRMWARLIESIVTKDELETYTASGAIDADNVTTDTTDFDGILGAGTTDVQLCLDALDDIDYDDISGNDAATDITGAELEELSDGSETTLHDHDVTGLTGWLGPYLPLVATSSYPLSGDLFVYSNYIEIRTNGPATLPYARFEVDPSNKALELRLINNSDCYIDISSNPSNNDEGIVRINYETLTTDVSGFEVYNGTAGPSIQHSFYGGGGDASLCQQGGELDLRGAFTAPVTTQTGLTLTPTNRHHTILCDGTSNTVTINLPTAAGITGRIYNIKAINIDNAVTVSPNGAEEIDGDNTDITLALMESITIQSDGSNWWII